VVAFILPEFKTQEPAYKLRDAIAPLQVSGEVQWMNRLALYDF